MADILYDLTSKNGVGVLQVVADLERILAECEAAKEKLRGLI
jgi:hypothetical protein